MPLEERQLLTTPTLISVSASASNLTFGQAEVFTATVVTNPPSANIPTGGTVTFNNGTTTLGTGARRQWLGIALDGVAGRHVLGDGVLFRHRHVRAAARARPPPASSSIRLAPAPLATPSPSHGQAATAAELANPFGVAVGPTGTIYIADTFNNEIDSVNPNTGVIKVLAGNGTAGLVDGPALSAEFQAPRGLALDAPLNLLFIADRDNNAIRELNLATGMVSTVAGNGTFGDGGAGIPATSAELASPTAVAVANGGLNVFIADTFNNVVREVNLTTGIITTVAGTRYRWLQWRRWPSHVRRALRPLRRGRR